MSERNIGARLREIKLAEIRQRERVRERLRTVARLPLYVIGILGIATLPTAFYLFETDLANREAESKKMQYEWTLEMAAKLYGRILSKREGVNLEHLRGELA